MVHRDFWCQISALHFMWSFTPVQSKCLIAFDSWFSSVWHLYYNVEMTLQCAKLWKKLWSFSWLFPCSWILRFHSKGKKYNSSHPDSNSLFLLVCYVLLILTWGGERKKHKGKREKLLCLIHSLDPQLLTLTPNPAGRRHREERTVTGMRNLQDQDSCFVKAGK